MSAKLTKDNVLFYRPNELHPQLISTAGFNIRPGSLSGPRGHMLNSQMGQKPAIINGEPFRVYTGIEREHARWLHLITMPVDGIVRDIISMYANHLPEGQNSPKTIIIYERMDDGRIDEIVVPHNHCRHQTFGFEYIRTDVMKNLYMDQHIPADTILAKPITLNDDGDWCLGRNIRIGLFPSEEGIEDGLALSVSAAKNFQMYGFGTVDIAFGKNKILLNVHGDDNEYKPWLNIGETIPASGIIVAGREYSSDLAPSNMSKKALQRVNNTDDPKSGIPGATIVDIRVIKGNPNASNLPPEIEKYVDKYWDKTQQFHESILKAHKKFKQMYNSYKYPMSSEWNVRVQNALLTTAAKNGAKKETYRNQTLDDTVLIIQYAYIHTPNEGGKYTGRQADKAVAVKIIPDHLMPIGPDGIRLDGYMDDASTSNRMNTPRLDEVLMTSCAETCAKMMRVAYEEEHNLDKAWGLLRRFFEIISPPSMLAMDAITNRDDMIEEIEWILLPKEEVPKHYISGIRIASPPDMPIDWVKAIRQLDIEFPAIRGKLKIYNKAGELVETKYDSIVGEMGMISLERAGNRFAATASSKRQHHGFPVKPSKTERASSPINDSPTRGDGEDETRGENAINGGVQSIEVFDRALNPEAHRQECRSIFAADNPARISNTVPRNASMIDPTVQDQEVIPFTGGRVSDIRDHVLKCGGAEFAEGEDGDAV